MVPARQVLAVKTKSEKMVKHHMVFFFIVSHAGVGFWKVLVLGLFFSSHSAVGFWKVLAVEVKSPKNNLEFMFWKVLAVKTNSPKKGKTPHGFLLFYCISFGCRLLEDFGFGFVFCFSFSCRLLEGSGCGDECAKTT